ncbi:MAG: GNAT family N-acetyltransferase [Bacteroidales bacterium]|nr:GNAT family N-acetyltransferase [Bacteroidales bacterium]
MANRISFENIIIETPKFFLKTLKIENSSDLFKIYSDKEVQQYTDNELITNITEAEKLILSANNKSKIFIGIFIKNTDKLIGTISIYNINFKHSFSSLGIVLDKKYWNQAIMYNSLIYLLDFYFNKLNFNRIEAQAFVKNYAAIRLFEKLDFKNEGRLRENFLIKGKFEDSYLFSILKNNFTISNK